RAAMNGLPNIAGSASSPAASLARARFTHERPLAIASSSGGSSTSNRPGARTSTTPPARSTQPRTNSGSSGSMRSELATVIGRSLLSREVLAEQRLVVRLALQVALLRAHQPLTQLGKPDPHRFLRFGAGPRVEHDIFELPLLLEIPED